MHLPLLSLETFRPRWSEPGEYVVIEREEVVAMSEQAASSGVRIGMRRGGVAAIATEAVMHDRDPAQEQAALDCIALALLQYTPEVAMSAESSLLLDVTASLRVFGGRLALCRLVRATIAGLGFSARIGSAPTAQGAWMLARGRAGGSIRQQRRAITMENMIRMLDRLPCVLLPEVRPFQDWLQGIGCRTLADLRKLPRAGIQRRCSKEVLSALDRVYGEAPELFNWVQAPPSFQARLELPDRIEYADAVLFAARRLILQMIGWLSALQLAVARFVLLLEHERGRQAVEPTAVDITLAEPAWREDHLIRLLKERLGRIELGAPVIALRLEATRVEPMQPPTESLFAEPGGTPADHNRLLELLTARLGTENVLVPAPIDDHRPEVGNAWGPAVRVPAMAAKKGAVKRNPANNASAAQPSASADAAGEGAERPFWILEKPIPLLLRDHRPFYASPLRMVSGPERIEAGWWDGQLASRDYFVAQGADCACYWVYRERIDENARWFLHGLFG